MQERWHLSSTIHSFTALLWADLSCIDVTCPPGWMYYNDHCYQLFSVNTSQSSSMLYGYAAKQCFQAGAELLSVNNAAEQTAMAALIPQTDTALYWIGLYVTDTGDVRWLDGLPALYRIWTCSASTPSGQTVLVSNSMRSWDHWQSGSRPTATSAK